MQLVPDRVMSGSVVDARSTSQIPPKAAGIAAVQRTMSSCQVQTHALQHRPSTGDADATQSSRRETVPGGTAKPRFGDQAERTVASRVNQDGAGSRDQTLVELAAL